MGCEWLRCVIGECNCRLLDALSRWAQGGHGLRVVAPCYWGRQWVASGGAVSLGNATADGSEVEIWREKCSEVLRSRDFERKVVRSRDL